ncbi:hypothetical protein [Longispora urticae]
MLGVGGRYAVATRLDGPPGRLNPETLVDLLWAHALPADQLDHVRARAPDPDQPGRLETVLILRAAGPTEAAAAARTVLDRAVAAPPLRDWAVTGLHALPLADLPL